MKALPSLDSWKGDIFYSWNQKNIIIIKMKLTEPMKETITCKLRLHISQNYKSKRHCHRITKNGLTSIFTSHKWIKETTSPSQDTFGLELSLFVKVADVEQRRSIWKQLERACF